MTHLTVYLPHLCLYQIEALGLNIEQTDCSVEKLDKDWQQDFIEAIDYPREELPWAQLRVTQFNSEKDDQFACCCDPVLLQLTHRGAYMMGQQQLAISENDAIRIVAQVNERLMGPHERLLLVDKYSWLYISDKQLTLESQSIRRLIGKDMFDQGYRGKQASDWQKLNTEIQMLIKEMMDYQGLTPSAPETLINVHFYDPVNVKDNNELPFINREQLVVCSDNELVKSFCMNSLISQQPVADLSDIEGNVFLINFDSEKENYLKIIHQIQTSLKEKQYLGIVINCADAKIVFQSNESLLSKFKRLLKQ
ncbi:hypothetical protein FLL45_02315 [Aliikangiella marina]|uniref:Uncharacterized protein n=1 Tax=Aliikangiella marina TaxID=1712262 RepID=A0A545THX0_9GAMM|nr:hypothetical protein [Aliikangiella marina]TQV76812.1 hypothetical protein FLL45_02315 [Aliikangiella marina]